MECATLLGLAEATQNPVAIEPTPHTVNATLDEWSRMWRLDEVLGGDAPLRLLAVRNRGREQMSVPAARMPRVRRLLLDVDYGSLEPTVWAVEQLIDALDSPMASSVESVVLPCRLVLRRDAAGRLTEGHVSDRGLGGYRDDPIFIVALMGRLTSLSWPDEDPPAPVRRGPREEGWRAFRERHAPRWQRAED